MKHILVVIALMLVLFTAACGEKEQQELFEPVGIGGNNAIKDDQTSYGEDLTSTINKGYFDGETRDVVIECISGTPSSYSWDGSTLLFSGIGEDSVYSIKGKLNGNIVIDIEESKKLRLELLGFSLISDTECPIAILNGDKIELCTKNGYESFIYDERGTVSEEKYSGAIYSSCDLELCGKGSLIVNSENNNGIHSKKDLNVKNLKLIVSCRDNALKGNDSVTVESGELTLIAATGDGIKTTNSDISEKGNQRGTVLINGGKCGIFAACDGIDSAYNVEVNNEGAELNIYTDKYSSYSDNVTKTEENVYYIRFSSSNLKYSIKYYNSDSDILWVDAVHHSTVSSGRSSYYYYSFEKKSEYSKMQIFLYTTEMEQGQDEEYYACTDYLTPNSSYDTFAIGTRGGSLGYSWTNYTTTITGGGMGGFGGGMGEGNSDKGTYSTKGIKANNEIVINNGKINIKSYDDALHANNDEELENGASPLGKVTVNNGALTVYSNDDGLHADGELIINGGNITIVNSYEGIEGSIINIRGGNTAVSAKDDGINSTATQGKAVTISGGELYVYCSGDGIDANTRESYGGITFDGGDVVVISTSNGNSALDTENGYTYNGGKVIAIMPSGGMSNEATHCKSFSGVGTSKSISLSMGSSLIIEVDGEAAAKIEMPISMKGFVVYLGSNSASISTEE